MFFWVVSLCFISKKKLKNLLVILESWFSLLCEGTHSFLSVLSCEGAIEQSLLIVQSFLKAQVIRLIDAFLSDSDFKNNQNYFKNPLINTSKFREAADLLGNGQSFLNSLSLVNDLADQPVLFSFLGSDGLSSEDDFHGF